MMMTGSQQKRVAARYIPKNSIEIASELGAVYVYRAGARYAAIAYAGTAKNRTFHYSYRDMEAVDVAVCNFFDSLKVHQARVANYRTESYKPHSFKVGDVITNSWGYDQTNVDFYRIVKTTANFVWLQPICAQTEETGFMCGNSTPAIDTDGDNPTKWGFADKGQVTKHKASGGHVSMKYGCGSKWDGQPMRASWYA